ncbi:hypothetical protein BsWGS_08070 [Bradybaena similaris]
MDLSMRNNSPIIIHSEDEDDDDVVLVKEEKVVRDAGANDDVIFVSEESSPSLRKSKSANQNNNKNGFGPASSSAVSANDGFTISHFNVQVYNSAFLSLSSLDGILQPLDSTESVALGADELSASTNTSFNLPEPLQAYPSCMPQQKVKTDAGVSSLDKHHQSSEKSCFNLSLQQNSLLKPAPKVPSNSATSTIGIDFDSLCDDRIAALPSDVLASPSDDSVKLVTSTTSDSQQSTSSIMTYSSERDPVQGTSNHGSNLDDFHVSAHVPDTVKLCITEKTTASSNSDSPLASDIDIFEDFLNIFTIFDNHVIVKDQNCDKNAISPDSSDMKGNKTSVDSAQGSHRVGPTVEASGNTECSVSSIPTSQDHCNASKSDKQMACNVEAASPDSTCFDYFQLTKNPSIISPIEASKLGMSPDNVSAAMYNISSHVPSLSNSAERSGFQSASRHASYLIRNMSRTHPYKQLNSRKYNLNYYMRIRDTRFVPTVPPKISLKSISQDIDTKAPLTGAAQWKIVSSETSTKKRAASSDIMNYELTKRNTLEASEEKPNLKIKLKMVPSSSSSVSSSDPKVSTTFNPCSIGFKKSIMRRQASLVEEAEETLMDETQPIVQQPASDSQMEGVEEEGDIQMCTTCCKIVSEQKMAKCAMCHHICATCLEPQVKVILTGDVKQKNVKCPSDKCTEALSFDELRKTLPSFVVDILEKKLDKEYLSYITKWMFTDEQLKTRSEFATLDTKVIPAPDLEKYEEVYSQESCDVAPDLPAFWAPMERGAPVMAFEVVPDTEEYRALACQFYETCPFGDYDIARIIRVQNPILWKYFDLKQSEMIQENDGMDVVVKRLYHGTHHSTLEAIARKGFDWRLSGKHGTVFGNGSYFARTAQYSHAYTDCAGSGVSVKTSGRSSYVLQSGSSSLQSYTSSLQSGTSSLSHYSYHSLRQSSLWGIFPTLQSLNPACSCQSPSLQSPLFPRPCICPHKQVPPNQATVNDAACGLTPAASRSSSLDIFLGASTSSAGPSMLYSNSQMSSLFSTAAPSQTQSPHFGSSFINPSLPTSGLGLLQTTSLPTLCSWDSMKDKKADIQIKPDPDHTPNSSGSTTVLPCRGKGTANLSSAFARDANSKTHFMFVAKVLVGRHTGGKSGLKRPPPLDDSNPYGKCYDSCVDNIFSPLVYVIFDSNQAYPEYIIEYNWHKG